MKKIVKAFQKHLPFGLIVLAATLFVAASLSPALARASVTPTTQGQPTAAQECIIRDIKNSDGTTTQAFQDKEGNACVDQAAVNALKKIADDEKKKNQTISCTGAAKTDCGGIIKNIVNPAIRLLTGLVGVIIAISIVIGGIMYSSAGGDPSKVQAAKKRITDSVIALLCYIFLFAFLQWLIPGGIV